MEATAIEDYSWVELSYLVHEFVFISGKEISFDHLEIKASSDWEISSILDEKGIFHRFEGCYVPLYAFIFQYLEVLLPLTHFKKEVLNHLCIHFATPSL